MTASVIPATTFLLAGEKAFMLAEVNRPSPLPGKGWRRMQIVQVLRGEDKAQFERDLGPMKHYTADEFQIPGAMPYPDPQGHWRWDMVHTVAQLQDMAERLRMEASILAAREPEDLWGHFWQRIEQGSDYRKRNGRTATL